jgi:hypothetical protein
MTIRLCQSHRNLSSPPWKIKRSFPHRIFWLGSPFPSLPLLFLTPTTRLWYMHMTSLPPFPVLCSPHSYDFSPMLPCVLLTLSKGKPSHSFPASYWFTQVLCQSQWELMGWLLRSLLFLYTLMFSQGMCFACCLLHASLLLGLLKLFHSFASAHYPICDHHQAFGAMCRLCHNSEVVCLHRF